MKQIIKDFINLIIKYNKYVLTTLILMILFISGIVINAKNKSNDQYYISEQNNNIKVEIIGEVKYPSVYNIPLNTKVKELLFLAGGLTEYADTSLINLNAFVENNEIIVINKGVKNPNRININTATISQLMSLPGIGKTKAEKILLYRKTHGSFKNIQDLEKVEGISANTIIELIDEITLS